MERLRARILPAAFGASAGLAGLLSLSKCTGGGCSSCFGCAGAGIGVLLIAVYGKIIKTKKEVKDGLA